MNTSTRKPLLGLEAGDKVTMIEGLKLVGPRGGRYVFDALRPTRNGEPTAAVFTGRTLSSDGLTRTFNFDGMASFDVASKLALKLVVQVQA